MKKSNKENPLSFFRKSNEVREKNVKTSLKKAQEGIQTNGNLLQYTNPSSVAAREALKKNTPWDKKTVVLETPKPIAPKKPDWLTPTREKAYPNFDQYSIDPGTGKVKFTGPSPSKREQQVRKQIADEKAFKKSGPGSGMGNLYREQLSNETPMKKGGVVKRKKK